MRWLFLSISHQPNAEARQAYEKHAKREQVWGSRVRWSEKNRKVMKRVSYFLAKASFHMWRLSSRSDAIHIILFSGRYRVQLHHVRQSIPVEVGEEEVSLFFALDSEGSCSLTFRWCPCNNFFCLVAFTTPARPVRP